MIKVVIIGAGNLATHLYRSFSESETLEVIQVFNRNPEHLDFVSPEKRTSDICQIKKADLYLLAIKDEALADFSQKLPKFSGIIAHCSGSEPMGRLSEFENYGVFYPLQSFSKEKPLNFKDIPICVEANKPKNLNFLKSAASGISDQIFEVNSEQRKALHLSAVFVNNFTNHMFTLAADFCRKHELPFKILKPLIKETFEKINSLTPYAAQTGPAIRGDKKTIQAHQEMLEEDAKKVYLILTESIQKLHGKEL